MSVEIKDPDGDAVRFNADEKGIWVDVEEHVAGAPARTVAAGPFPVAALRDAVDEALHGQAAVRAQREEKWAKVGVLALVLPPAAWLCGLPHGGAVWGAAVALWLCAYVWRSA